MKDKKKLTDKSHKYTMAMLSISSNLDLSDIADEISKVLNINLIRDSTGRFEEIPAYTSHVLGFEIYLMGEDPDEKSGVPHGYFLKIYPDASLSIFDSDGWKNIDIATQIKFLLRNNKGLTITEE